MIPEGHDWIDIATLIVALIVSIGGLSGIIGWIMTRRKTASETRKLDADTAMVYQQIADAAAAKALEQDEHINMQDKRIAALEDAIRVKDKRIDELEKDNADLHAQVELLQQKVFQLEGKNNRA